MRLVVDASVAVKWAHTEHGHAVLALTDYPEANS